MPYVFSSLEAWFDIFEWCGNTLLCLIAFLLTTFILEHGPRKECACAGNWTDLKYLFSNKVKGVWVGPFWKKVDLGIDRGHQLTFLILIKVCFSLHSRYVDKVGVITSSSILGLSTRLKKKVGDSIQDDLNITPYHNLRNTH